MKTRPGHGQPHVAVVGAGAFGGWTALHLRQAGADVTLLDTWGPGNSRASSGDETRVIRSIYGPDEIYVGLVQRALDLWGSLEKSRGLQLYRRTGALWMFGSDDAYARASLPYIAARGMRAEDSRFEEGQLPVWLDRSANAFCYGIPGSERRGFKFGDDTPGAAFDPTNGERIPTAAGFDAARRYVARRFPGLARAPLVESRVCTYELSADRHYVVDRHPDASNAWIAGGGSGHGFKVGPAIGEHIAACVLERAQPAPQFALARRALAGR